MFISQNLFTGSSHFLECSWTLIPGLNIATQAGPLCFKFLSPLDSLYQPFSTTHHHHHPFNISYTLFFKYILLLIQCKYFNFRNFLLPLFLQDMGLLLEDFFFCFSFCWTGKNPALVFKNQGAVTKLQRMKRRKERTDVHRQRSSYSDTIRPLQQLLSLLCSWNLPKNGKLSKEKFFFSK